MQLLQDFLALQRRQKNYEKSSINLSGHYEYRRFIVVNMVKNAEVNSTEQTLIAVLSSDQIAIACTKYGAILRTFVDV